MGKGLKGVFSTALSYGGAFVSGGWASVGLLAASEIFGGSQKSQGARLTDLSVQISQEGAELPRGWGTWRQGGNIVWSSGIKERKKKKKRGKGGPTETTFSYTVSLAILGGQGPITSIRQGRFNNVTLWDDKYTGDEAGITFEEDPAGFLFGKAEDGTKVRIYLGTLDQPVDALLEAVHGVGNFTAYPGQWYIMLEDMPLKNYGNSIPNGSFIPYNTNTDVTAIILEIGGWVGMTADDFDLTALDGLTVAPTVGEGFVVDTRKSAADCIGDLMELFHFTLPEVDGVFRATMRAADKVAILTDAECRVHVIGEGTPDVGYTNADETTLPEIEETIYRNPDREHNVGYCYARREATGSKKKSSISYGGSIRGGRAQQLTNIRMAEKWAMGTAAKASLGIEYLWLSAGDAVGIIAPDGERECYLSELTPPFFGPISATMPQRDILAYSLPMPADPSGVSSRPPDVAGAPISFFAESVVLRDEMRDEVGAVQAATQTSAYRWRGANSNIERWTGTEWKNTDDDAVEDRATIGELLADVTLPRFEDGYISGVDLPVKIFYGELANAATLDLVKEGANLMLFENGVLVSFQFADFGTEDGAGVKTYTLSMIRAGRYTSDDLITGPLAAGLRFVMLTDSENDRDEAVLFTTLPSTWLGLRIRSRYTANDTDPVKQNSVEIDPYKGVNMQEPKPILTTVERGLDGSLRLVGYCRSRFLLNDDWEIGDDMQMSATLFSSGYKYQIMLDNGPTEKKFDRYTTDDEGRFDFTVAASELDTLFGSVPGDINGTIGIYGKFGAGRPRAFDAPPVQEIEVQAIDSTWTDTGIVLSEGDRVEISTTGTGSHVSGASYGPDGAIGDNANGFPYGALVGVLMPGSSTPSGAESGSFLVGSSLHLEQQTGHLFLRFNDDVFFDDNTGSYAVTLRVWRTE